MHTTPKSLLERLRQPDRRDAWDRFAELYTPLLYYWARRVGLQQQDAADLVQDVFATLIQKLPGFAYDQHKSFRGWLRTVTLNKWRDRCKHQNRHPVATNAGGVVAKVVSPDESEAFWEDEYRKKLVNHAMEVMRNEFQPATWKACWEFVVEGRTAAEVAAELGISENAVYIAKNRVLRRLRQELEGLME